MNEDVKLEAGQRWRYRTPGGALVGRERLLLSQDKGWWRIHGQPETSEDGVYLRICCALVAPAPAAGQRWKLPGFAPAPICHSSHPDMLSIYAAPALARVGTHVDLAIWLLEQGAEYLGGGPETRPANAREATPWATALARVNSEQLAEADPYGWFCDLFAPRRASPSVPQLRTAPSQLRHIRALGEAVNAVLVPTTVADTRRSVDVACRQLRGEPFAEAIRAVLVAMVETSFSPAVIACVINGCRAWEEERSRVAPGRRALTEEQRLACEASAGRHIWTTNGGAVYERARSTCRA